MAKGKLYKGINNIAKEVDALRFLITGGSGSQLFKPANLINNGFIDTSTGEVVEEAGEEYNYTDYLKVYNNSTIELYLGCKGHPYAGCAWYDDDKQFISGFHADTLEPGSYVAPGNAAYMRATHNTNYLFTDDAYITRYGGYRKVKKVYVGDENGIARLCYNGIATVTYQTNSKLTLSTTSKDILILNKYGTLPISKASARVDFWFKNPNATTKHDSTKKYIDNPWCLYADANPNVYNSYGYNKDLLAQHWNDTGSKNNYSLGSITSSSVCATREDHTLQHVARPKSVSWSGQALEFLGSDSFYAWEVYNSKGTKIYQQDSWSHDTSWTLYPGMKIKFTVRQHSGLFGNTNNTAIKIDGVTKKSGAGSYTYTIPDNVSAIKAVFDIDEHQDFSASEIITVTTTKVSYL